MSVLPLIYYGKPGLEADVFQAYMASSGFTVHMVTDPQGRIPESVFNNASVTVISLPKSNDELVRLANEIRAQSSGGAKRVLILADGQPFHVEEPEVEVIFRPYRLSEIADRIRAISRID